MSDQILTFLKFCLVAILYLFLARVVWIVARELRGTPAPAPAVPAAPSPARPRKGKAWRLVLVEPAAEAGATGAGCGVPRNSRTTTHTTRARKRYKTARRQNFRIVRMLSDTDRYDSS